ncbi:cation:dicarboxylase symporter family transporter [Bacillus sp. DX3.1]|uniref:cation:dicarboxylate symporter family transporter n=1 Tax=Bacillus sp. DX3.1 TaxID=3052091 RepID=UPI002570AFDB|nr:cation:dicarboxylase symporter family transporter [Bacillus sp. DX3.1]WJE84496.1 cation:dicarboxylase symporter family transporter [Bacillus sp. DX3.1]
MNLVYIAVNMVVMLVMLGILYRMQKKYVSFTKRVFTGLGMGIVFGTILQIAFDGNSSVVKTTTEWFNLVGDGYVGFLKMIVMPLIMVSIISAITNLKSSNGLGKMSGFIIGMLIFTTMISAGVGIASSNLFNLTAESIQAGDAETARGELLEQKLTEVENQTIPQKVLQFIPTNPFLDMTGGRPTSTLGVVIFSAFVGVAALQIKRKNQNKQRCSVKLSMHCMQSLCVS